MAHGDGDGRHSPRKMDRELRDAISALTRHLTGLADERGLGLVTLAGSNKGAVLKAGGGLLDGEDQTERHGMPAKKWGEEPKVSAYTNSNYQAVNNSIMVDGKCEAEDPGVHIEIVDCIDGGREGDDEEEDDDDDDGQEIKKKKDKKKKEKKKEKKEKHSEGKDAGKGSDNE